MKGLKQICHFKRFSERNWKSNGTILNNEGDPLVTPPLAEQSRVVALDVAYRKRAYEQITALASDFGIYAYVCGCKNPDITEETITRNTKKR